MPYYVVFLCEQLMQMVTGTSVSQNVVIAMSGIAKVYVGEIVEAGMYSIFSSISNCLKVMVQNLKNLQKTKKII